MAMNQDSMLLTSMSYMPNSTITVLKCTYPTPLKKHTLSKLSGLDKECFVVIRAE